MPIITGTLLATGLLKLAGITGSILAARGIGKVIQNVGERVFPIEESRAYKLQKENEKTQFALESTRENFQVEVLERQLQQNHENLLLQLPGYEVFSIMHHKHLIKIIRKELTKVKKEDK